MDNPAFSSVEMPLAERAAKMLGYKIRLWWDEASRTGSYCYAAEGKPDLWRFYRAARIVVDGVKYEYVGGIHPV